MVVRDAPGGNPGARPGGLEVLMVRRNLRSDFVGGAYVFPGGALDPSDYSESLADVCPGRRDRDASSLLGIDAGGLAYWVAVLRECFEEAGVLLAYSSDSFVNTTTQATQSTQDRDGAIRSFDDRSLISFADPKRHAHFQQLRAALNSKEKSFLQLCVDERLSLAVERVFYFAHWITPEGAPRRYDTRFFVARAPAGQSPANDAGETIDEVWIAPSDALRRHNEGQMELIFPTIRNLQAISRFKSCDELMGAAAAAEGSVPVVEPRVLLDGNGVRIVLPGDPGYDDTNNARPPSDPTVFNEAVRKISRENNE